MTQRLIIVGAGMAAAYLLRELARLGTNADIVLIGEEQDACYNRVLLSGVLAGETADTELQMLEEDRWPSSVRLITDTRVSAVNVRDNTVLTDKGETLAYDKLVFATGAKVAIPDVAASEIARGVSGVRVLRTLDDVRHMRALPADGRRAVVVGGGLLGLEAAHGLNSMGFEVSVIHRQAYLMNRQLDREGGDHLRHTLERSGIRFCLGGSLSSIQTAGDTLTAITLQDGRTLDCELLVFATGIDPHAVLAREAGIDCMRGIVVDEYLRTSDPDCYALGECSQIGAQCFGLVAPIKAQAAILAGQLMSAVGAPFVFEDWPVQLKISGIEIFSTGSLDAGDDQLVMRNETAGIYRRLVLKGNQLVGAVLVGDKREGLWYAQLIQNATDISRYRSGLMFGKAVSEAMQMPAFAD